MWIPSFAASTVTQHLHDELDQAQRRGAVRDIVIPPCPELLRQLQEATARGEPDIGAIDRIASADVAMAAALIRQANSPFYGLEHPVHTVGQAMTVIGLQPAIRLLSGFLTRQAIRPQSAMLAHFWESSTRRAIACEHIGQQLYDMDPGLAYSFGLFCHVGIPVMLRGVKGYASTMTEALARKDRTFTQTENANHRTDHAVVGALVARAWRLAPGVMAAIRLHHSLESLGSGDTEPEVHTLVAVGLVADYLLAQRSGLSPEPEWERHGADACDWLAISADDLHHWQETLAEAEAIVPA